MVEAVETFLSHAHSLCSFEHTGDTGDSDIACLT